MLKIRISTTRILSFFLALATLLSCRQQGHKPIQDIDMELIKVQRFEQDLFSIPFDSVAFYVPVLSEKYGGFFEGFSNYIINIGGTATPGFSDRLLEFFTNYDVNLGYKNVLEVFPDISFIEKGLSGAFSQYRHHFPGETIPGVVTYVGGFNQSLVIGDSLLAIGLDKYLGRDCELYHKIGYPSYQRLNMHKHKIVPDCMFSWAKTEYAYNNSVDNLLSQMVYHGKLLYFAKALLPNTPDSLIMGFTNQQMEFCRNNEKKMWEYLVEHKLLFNTNQLTISKFINDGPFTKDFSASSPSRAATWIGLQIVQNYMKRNKVALKQLMEDLNYMEIYNNSRYIP